MRHDAITYRSSESASWHGPNPPWRISRCGSARRTLNAILGLLDMHRQLVEEVERLMRSRP